MGKYSFDSLLQTPPFIKFHIWIQFSFGIKREIKSKIIAIASPVKITDQIVLYASCSPTLELNNTIPITLDNITTPNEIVSIVFRLLLVFAFNTSPSLARLSDLDAITF